MKKIVVFEKLKEMGLLDQEYRPSWFEIKKVEVLPCYEAGFEESYRSTPCTYEAWKRVFLIGENWEVHQNIYSTDYSSGYRIEDVEEKVTTEDVKYDVDKLNFKVKFVLIATCDASCNQQRPFYKSTLYEIK